MRSFSTARQITLVLIGPVLIYSLQAFGDGPPAQLQVHEWSVWITEPTQGVVNAVGGYPSAMPGIVETTRSRRAEPQRPNVSPLSMITFSDKAENSVDLSIRMTNGRFVAHWPPADVKNNRLAWNDLKISADAGEGGYGFVADDHWFTRARKLDALQVQRGARTERFLAYDPELNLSLAVRLEGGPDKYRVFNAGKYALKDVVVIAPAEGGRRIGWLDELPAGTTAEKGAKSAAAAEASAAVTDAVVKVAQVAQAVAVPLATKNEAKESGVAKTATGSTGDEAARKAQPEASAEITMTAPLSEEQLNAAGPEALKKRLAAAGLKDSEIELILSLYGKAFFQASETVLLFRLPQGTIDELLPLDIDPDTAKIARVALVLCFKVDPLIRDQVQKLVDQLGDNAYTKREEAELKLRDLGRMAIPALKEAVKSSDPERVMRAERLLLRQNEKLEGK
jgi:hypothetical protein